MPLKTGEKESQLWITSKKHFHHAHNASICSGHSMFLSLAVKNRKKKNRKQISSQDVCLKCGHPIQAHHGRDSGLNLPPPSQVSRVHRQFTDGCSSLAESYSGLNNLPHQVDIKHLNTLAYEQSRPTNPERGTWWPPGFLTPSTGSRDGNNCFVTTCWNITELDSFPSQHNSKWQNGSSSASDTITEPKKSFSKKESPSVSGAVQIQGTASAEESQKSQQIKQTRATRRSNSVG